MKDAEDLLLGKPLKDIDGPLFDKPWQARAFALVVNMNKAGLFPWKDWSATLGAVIKAEPQQPGETVNDAYYRQWMAALEKMVASLGLVDGADVTSRAEQWRKAYLNTPHGVPITLCNAEKPPAQDTPAPRREPIKVVPASA